MFAIISILSLISCNDTTTKEPQKEGLVSFKSRSIDLQPYFEGFPFKNFIPSYKANKVFYMELADKIKLMQTDLSNTNDLTMGDVISDIDFSKRNVWGIKYNEFDSCLYWMGDEKNDEIINLFKLDPRTKEVTKLTDVPYIFGWTFNKDKSKIAYVARLGHIDERKGELRILDLNSNSESTVYSDSPEMRLTWCSPKWSEDESTLITAAFKNADRTYGNLVSINIIDNSMNIITDENKKRSYPVYSSKWLSDGSYIMYSNEDGFYNLYIVNANGEQTQLSNFTTDVAGFEILTLDDEEVILCATSNPIETNLHFITIDGEVTTKKFDGKISFIDSEENKVLVSTGSPTTRFALKEMTIGENYNISYSDVLNEPKELTDKIVNASSERHEFESFDGTKIHAYLLSPTNPLPKEEQIVIIQSFYGGDNSYSTRQHILAEAGIHFFSPSPRGSSGFGREFSAMNDKDLGGNEIIDIIYAAEYISKELGIPAERIGVWGRSHGGYASMRLMTFPGEINGNKASFNFGFGMADAGFSDIIHFYENCNIPDWVTLEAGDPKTEQEKLNDRSPLYHADKAVGPILLTHGTNDSRVPKEGSIWFADSLKKYNKEHKLVLFDGEGHSVKGLSGFKKLYKARFEFLNEIYK